MKGTKSNEKGEGKGYTCAQCGNEYEDKKEVKEGDSVPAPTAEKEEAPEKEEPEADAAGVKEPGTANDDKLLLGGKKYGYLKGLTKEQLEELHDHASAKVKIEAKKDEDKSSLLNALKDEMTTRGCFDQPEEAKDSTSYEVKDEVKEGAAGGKMIRIGDIAFNDGQGYDWELVDVEEDENGEEFAVVAIVSNNNENEQYDHIPLAEFETKYNVKVDRSSIVKDTRVIDPANFHDVKEGGAGPAQPVNENPGPAQVNEAWGHWDNSINEALTLINNPRLQPRLKVEDPSNNIHQQKGAEVVEITDEEFSGKQQVGAIKKAQLTEPTIREADADTPEAVADEVSAEVNEPAGKEGEGEAPVADVGEPKEAVVMSDNDARTAEEVIGAIIDDIETDDGIEEQLEELIGQLVVAAGYEFDNQEAALDYIVLKIRDALVAAKEGKEDVVTDEPASDVPAEAPVASDDDAAYSDEIAAAESDREVVEEEIENKASIREEIRAKEDKKEEKEESKEEVKPVKKAKKAKK
jgi:hypothetical protein